jgi:hypothetical protein
MARFEVPDGWGVQAFRFTLDPTEEQACWPDILVLVVRRSTGLSRR